MNPKSSHSQSYASDSGFATIVKFTTNSNILAVLTDIPLFASPIRSPTHHDYAPRGVVVARR